MNEAGDDGPRAGQATVDEHRVRPDYSPWAGSGRGPASLLAKPALNGSHAVAVSYPAPFPIRPSPPDQAQPSAPSRDSLDAAPAVRLGRSDGRRRVPRRRGLTRPERPRASRGLTEVFEVRKIARRLLNALRFSGFLAKARDCRRSASRAKRASLYIFLPGTPARPPTRATLDRAGSGHPWSRPCSHGPATPVRGPYRASSAL